VAGRKNGDQGQSGETDAQQMEQAGVAYTMLILRINPTNLLDMIHRLTLIPIK
jgi:hypothetical protein